MGGEYQVRPPMRPTHFFLIDVSQPAIASGATLAVCSSVARLLDELPGGDRTQVCSKPAKCGQQVVVTRLRVLAELGACMLLPSW